MRWCTGQTEAYGRVGVSPTGEPPGPGWGVLWGGAWTLSAEESQLPLT